MVEQKKSLEECERQLELRDRFLSWAILELRAPLTALSGVMQLQGRLLASLVKGEAGMFADASLRLQIYMDYSQQQLRRIELQLQNLSDLVGVQRGTLVLHLAPLDFAQLVRTVLDETLVREAEDLGVLIQQDLPEEAWVRLDPVRAKEVVVHLVEFAFRRTLGGGVIRLSLELDPTLRRWVLRVEDPGRALSDEEREQIFLPYDWIGRPEKGWGGGLGLFLAQGLIHLQGGEVDLGERAARGSEWGNSVYLRLPRFEESEKGATDHENAPLSPATEKSS